MALRRIFTTGARWGGYSGLLSLTLPHALAASSTSLIYYPTTVAAATFATSTLVLFPVGLLRGVSLYAEDLSVPSTGDAVANHLRKHHAQGTTLAEAATTLRQGADDFDITRSLLSKGGVASRALLGLFLPSTEVLLEHLAREAPAATDSEEFLRLARGTTNGLIAGQIVVARDRITMAGGGIAAIVLCCVVVADQAAGRTKRAKDEVVAKVQEGADGVATRMEEVAGGQLERLKESLPRWMKEDDEDGNEEEEGGGGGGKGGV